MDEFKIVIDPGHGGADSGAVGNGIIEKDYTLKISKYMADRLRDLGADITLTRDSDITLNPSERTAKVLDAYGNSKDVLVISNHINAGGGDGAEVIYALRNTDELPNMILNNLEAQGQNIRRSYTRRLPSNPNKDYYFMLRDTGNTDAYIIEYGFLDSNKDDVVQLKNNWKNYAEAAVEAIANYLGLPYDINYNIPNEYVVKSGDTLWNIAKKYNTNVDEIKAINNLSNNLLSVGQRIKIPSDTNFYIVKAGDTLYSIARNNNTTVDNLKNLNGIIDNMLSIGQKLILSTTNNNYTVKAGDTLYSIAQKYNTTVDIIKSLNNLSNNLLNIGQQILLP